ncbi:16S rRNA (cytosine(967)-C(5))-methyltransferase RsmB [Salibacterium salarium]|uniref:16S rRNA (cytosine(967)-C(5))-methyltransferase n=1 Tax=Salibacterium salarium TaxID=284579 RepID=A0A3R9QIG4_9BACI|nr:16S rRNA (cytosine(967)-C(5))-methyltransferase RsmB [Salibacterium salarium]RSL31413.1 16S rRNA (cytosine(967)-C(5))-methyltransferase RsmB [Salibacterium salarium]
MYKNVREEALRMLERIDKEGAYSHLLLNHVLNEGSISHKDESLLTELVYGTIKRKNTLDYYIDPFIKKGVDSLQSWVLQLLRMSVYQFVYLDRVPERAVIHEAVQIAKKKGHKGISGLVNGVLRSMQRNGLPSIDENLSFTKQLALTSSHPVWLLEDWIKAYGKDKAENMAHANLQPPVLSVRVNQVKTNKQDLRRRLEEEGCTIVDGHVSEDALLVTHGNVIATESYQEGLCTIQDESSMLIARFLQPMPGMKVVDACAAPGGKTTHAGELMENEGMIHAFDLHDKKVGLINEQVQRLGLTNVEAKSADARQLTEELEPKSMDRVLVDAPCSGLGVVRRKPELKWQKQRTDLNRLPSIQTAILNEAAELVKPGGRLVYSTCTVRKEENEDVLQAFLEQNPTFIKDEEAKMNLPEKLTDHMEVTEGQLTIFPQDFQSDGFFMAALKRL